MFTTSHANVTHTRGTFFAPAIGNADCPRFLAMVPLWSLVEIPVCDTHCENDEYYYFKTLIPFGASACNYFQNCTVHFLGIFFITVQKSNFLCAEFNPNEFKQ
jgi:hypothetical protein